VAWLRAAADKPRSVRGRRVGRAEPRATRIGRCPRCRRPTLVISPLLASSISYVAGWSNADPTVLTAAATNVPRAVNTIAAGLGLHDADQAADVASVA
jgi:hypothetical protein